MRSVPAVALANTTINVTWCQVRSLASRLTIYLHYEYDEKMHLVRVVGHTHTRQEAMGVRAAHGGQLTGNAIRLYNEATEKKVIPNFSTVTKATR